MILESIENPRSVVPELVIGTISIQGQYHHFLYFLRELFNIFQSHIVNVNQYAAKLIFISSRSTHVQNYLQRIDFVISIKYSWPLDIVNKQTFIDISLKKIVSKRECVALKGLCTQLE